MKKIAAVILYILAVVIIIPLIAVLMTGGFFVRPAANGEFKEKISVYVTKEDVVKEMDTSQYLKEVVAAEMPADFSFEALKAQAVAARTYLISKSQKKDSIPEHKGADVCTDYNHCKAWMSEEERKNLWEEERKNEYWDKISRAVTDTAGEILTYEDEPISAVFHSTSSGMTEKAEDVWGTDVAYLQNVESEGDELSPRYSSEFSCDVNEFCEKAERAVPGVDWSLGLFSDIERSSAGGIISLKVGGVQIKGTQFREIFGLRSTNVEIVRQDNTIIMSVKGNGHGVGMSQYGANYLGNSGKGYEEILSKYYPGTTLVKKH